MRQHNCLDKKADDDDDDLDEESIPGFSHPEIAQTPRLPDKGKGRAQEHNQPGSSSANVGTVNTSLTGNIGSSQNSGPRTTTQTIGGVRVETRYAHLIVYVPRTLMESLSQLFRFGHTGRAYHNNDCQLCQQPFLLVIIRLIDPRSLVHLYESRSGAISAKNNWSRSSTVRVLSLFLHSILYVLLRRDWDLWGPLLLCLLLGIMLSINVCSTASHQMIYNYVHGRHPLVNRLEFSQVLS